MEIKQRLYIHIDLNDEGTIMAFAVTRAAWEGWIGANIHIGKILSSDGQCALFFTCNGNINYRVAMGVAGSYARNNDASWDIPF